MYRRERGGREIYIQWCSASFMWDERGALFFRMICGAERLWVIGDLNL